MSESGVYRYDFSASRQLYLCCQDGLTTVTLQQATSGQQQQTSQQVKTGDWTAVPQMYRLSSRFVVPVRAALSNWAIQIEGMQVQIGPLSTALSAQLRSQPSEPLQAVDAMPHIEVRDMDMPAMEMTGLSPMPPMSMKMGSMTMNMGSSGTAQSDATPSAQTQAQTTAHSTTVSSRVERTSPNRETSTSPNAASEAKQKQFCSQCGEAIAPTDRFCAYCGHRLGG